MFRLLILFLFLLAGCVGTVNTANVPATKSIDSTSNGSSSISFAGLISAKAIANDKVELIFLPAGGDQDKLTYEIYVNNAAIPVKVSGKSLLQNAKGQFLYTITALEMNTTYSFNVKVVETGKASSAVLDPTKSMSVTTFANATADFNGISSLTLAAGEAGKDTVTLKWLPAVIKGTIISTKTTDPVAYEIRYISQLGGYNNLNNASYAGPDKIIIQTPATLGTPPTLTTEKEKIITGLNPGVTYFFQVRALHKGWFTYSGSDSTYKKEINSKILSITTLSTSSVFDFDPTKVLITNPTADTGLTALDVAWLPASGEFNHYRVCSKKVANPLDLEPVTDDLQDSDIDVILNTNCPVVAASITNYRLTGLISYAFYQSKVLACRNTTCNQANRVKSDLMQKRVDPNLAPFTGILEITDPEDVSVINEVKLKFDAPVISSGYINQFNIYCYQDDTDLAPVLVPSSGAAIAASGKTNCDGIKLKTTLPTVYADFGNLEEVSVELPFTDGNHSYCFSGVPLILSGIDVSLDKSNLATAQIKCFAPNVKTPTIEQFVGRDTVCSVVNNKDLKVTWQAPTGGLFNNFVVFWKDKSVGSPFFSFADAVTAFEASNTAIYKFSTAGSLAATDVEYSTTNLIPGRKYSIGVLSYLDLGAGKKYSQYNLRNGECDSPLPSAKFEEWVEVLALGPKEDGLTPPTGAGVRSYILETLDDEGTPIEMKLNPDRSPDNADALAGAREGTDLFDGVYGKPEANAAGAQLHQYSNSGAIKIGWKDVSFYSGTETMSSFIASLELAVTKPTRKFGYRIYRSEDNQISWLDLTDSTKTTFQTGANTGLVKASNTAWKKTNNQASINENMAFFTDYSVKYSSTTSDVERARVFWYKIVPVFDGKELKYLSTGNTNHHLIKVTLPPPNMALVHRWMANRAMCYEMNKIINKNSGGNYTCDYNGVGSVGIGSPWIVGQTVYDQLGDLLVDRFELGCNFSRGDRNLLLSDSAFGGASDQFDGLSNSGNKFKGCFSGNSLGDNVYEPMLGVAGAANYTYKQVAPGDCFGKEDGKTFDARLNFSPCNPLLSQPKVINYPGAFGDHINDFGGGCTAASNTADNALDPSNAGSIINNTSNGFPNQSEFSGVYYIRKQYTAANRVGQYLFKGAGAEDIKSSFDPSHSSCFVNLAYLNATGKYVPRWFPLSHLRKNLTLKTTTSTKIELLDKSLSQIMADPNLYNGTNVVAPNATLSSSSRYNTTTTPLAKIVTTNAAKLPPVDGVSQEDLYYLCQGYKVQTGIQNTSTGVFSAIGDVTKKRLMRRKEQIAASAWPKNLDSAAVTNLEKGVSTNTCNSYEKNPIIFGANSLQMQSSINPNFPIGTGTSRTILMSGSSSLDPSGSNMNTEKCVSRYGIQDLVGNAPEHLADQFFCDKTQDTLFVGVSGSPNSSALLTTTMYYKSTFSAWALPTTASGTCSSVEAGGARLGTYEVSGIISSIFDYLGINTGIITAARTWDQDAVNSMRSGDGYFMDFGQNNLGPAVGGGTTLGKDAISTHDSYTLDAYDPVVDGNIRGKYFNPVVGLPLTCASGCVQDDDNKKITSLNLATTRALNAGTNPEISVFDFPTNNSHLTNTGLSEVITHSTLDPSDATKASVNYIDTITPGGPTGTANFLSTIPGNGAPGILQRSGFTISRNNNVPLYFLSGGNAGVRGAGRYTASLEGTDNNYQRNSENNNAGRCAILINTED